VEERASKLYPVEYKRGRKGEWKNDWLQLCAQAMCLEEMTGRSIPQGFVYYAASHQREEVEFASELRQVVVATANEVRKLFTIPKAPEPVPGPRCKGCSLYPVCLPRETQKLRNLPPMEDLL